MSDLDLEIFLAKNDLMTSDIEIMAGAIRSNKGDIQVFYALVIKELERYVAGHPQDAEGRALMGYAYFKKGYIDQAISQYELALKIKPDDYSIRHDLGVALREKGFRDGGC